MTKFEEKLKENHKIQNRVMLWYVRDSLLLKETRENFDKLLRSVDSWKNQLSDEDLMIADMLLKGGVDLDSILEFQESCKKSNQIHYKVV